MQLARHIFKSNLSLYSRCITPRCILSLHYAKACNEFAGPISFRVNALAGNTAPFEEISQDIFSNKEISSLGSKPSPFYQNAGISLPASYHSLLFSNFFKYRRLNIR